LRVAAWSPQRVPAPAAAGAGTAYTAASAAAAVTSAAARPAAGRLLVFRIMRSTLGRGKARLTPAASPIRGMASSTGGAWAGFMAREDSRTEVDTGADRWTLPGGGGVTTVDGVDLRRSWREWLGDAGVTAAAGLLGLF